MKDTRKKKVLVPQSMREKAYLHLQQKFLAGEFQAGSLISEASLAREVGVSRTPLREAIRQLIAEGFLKPTPNRGVAVHEFSRRDVAELYDLREALEIYAVGKAAQTPLRATDMEKLETLVDDVALLTSELDSSGQTHLNRQQMRQFVHLDLSYHILLLQTIGNARLLKIVGETRLLLNIFSMRRKGHSVAQLKEIVHYHSEILNAVSQQNAPKAMQLLSEHIRKSKRERLEEYEEAEQQEVILRTIRQLGVETKAAEEI